jgi:alpha-1,2-mannosyltransferase
MLDSGGSTPTRAFPSWLCVPGAAVFAISLAAFAMYIHVVGFDGYDLSCYLMGGDAYTHGLPVYNQRLHGDGSHFVYPPVTLLVFAPLSSLPYGIVVAAHLTLGILALWAVVWLTFRMLGFGNNTALVFVCLGITGCALWLQPVFDTLNVGQINAILMFLVVAGFALNRRMPTLAGVTIGVAAAVKLTPAIFIVYILLTRRFRVALMAIASAALLTCIGFVVAWADSVQYWLQGTFADTAYLIEPIAIDDVSNQSLNGVALRFFGDSGRTVWLVLALVVGIGGLAVAVRAERRGAPVAGLLTCAITSLLISPLSWHEHWIWVLPVGVLLGVVGIELGQARPILAGVPVLPIAAYLTWPLEYAPEQIRALSILSPARSLWEEGNHNPLVALVTTTYVSVGIFLLAVEACVLFRPTRAAVYTNSPSVRVAVQDLNYHSLLANRKRG